MAFYRLFVPPQAAGASAVHFDLFNASGSGVTVYVHSVQPIVDGSVAVTGVVAVNVFLTKTTAVGTGGTAATYEGTSLTAATISAQDNASPLNTSITARLTPTGGASAGGVLSMASMFTEETNAGAYTPEIDLAKGWVPDIPAIVCRQGQGIRVVQGGVASVGNVGYNVIFDVRP